MQENDPAMHPAFLRLHRGPRTLAEFGRTGQNTDEFLQERFLHWPNNEEHMQVHLHNLRVFLHFCGRGMQKTRRKTEEAASGFLKWNEKL